MIEGNHCFGINIIIVFLTHLVNYNTFFIIYKIFLKYYIRYYIMKLSKRGKRVIRTRRGRRYTKRAGKHLRCKSKKVRVSNKNNLRKIYRPRFSKGGHADSPIETDSQQLDRIHNEMKILEKLVTSTSADDFTTRRDLQLVKYGEPTSNFKKVALQIGRTWFRPTEYRNTTQYEYPIITLTHKKDWLPSQPRKFSCDIDYSASGTTLQVQVVLIRKDDTAYENLKRFNFDGNMQDIVDKFESFDTNGSEFGKLKPEGSKKDEYYSFDFPVNKDYFIGIATLISRHAVQARTSLNLPPLSVSETLSNSNAEPEGYNN